jgi:MFS family permease
VDSSRPRLWTKDFIIVSSANFFLTLVFYLLIVTISVFAVDQYKASTSQAGLVTGIFIIGTLIGRLFIGGKIDSIGRKKTLLIGLFLFTLTTFLYFFHFGINFLLFNRFLHGVTLGIASTASGTIVAQIIPETRKGEGIGYFSLSSILATAIGPFIGLFLIQHANFKVIFSFCLALGIISFITAWFLNVPAVKDTSANAEVKGFRLSNMIEPKALPIAFITLILGFCYSSVLSFINFYAMEINLVSAASFFFVIYAASVLVSRPITGRLMDQKGAHIIMYPAFFIMGSGMLLLSAVHHSMTLLLAGVLIGLGFGNMQSVSQAVAIKSTSVQRMGLATSTFFIFLDAGLGFGPYLIGFMIPLTGYRSLYAMMGIVVLATTLLYYFLFRKKEGGAKSKIAASISA